MKEEFCQSCGMKMEKPEEFGTNADGTCNHAYCTYCFQKGAFTEECTMEEMVEHNLKFLEEYNKDAETSFSKEEARAQMLAYFPTLGRWKKEN